VVRHPLLMLGPPLAVLAVCLGLGVYGVMAGAHKEMDDNRGVVGGCVGGRLDRRSLAQTLTTEAQEKWILRLLWCGQLFHPRPATEKVL
jgi:hypothetical protein